MRLLQAMAGAPQGGAEAFFERLVPALHRAGVTQQVLIRKNPARAEFLRGQGVAVEELPFGGILDFLTPLGFRRAVSTFRPTLVLTWMNRATKFCPRDPSFAHAARLGGYYDLKYYKNCHHLIGNTPDICRWVADQGWPAEKIHYLPNFVDATPAAAVPRETAQPLVLALGRLHPNKGFDTLIEALAALPEAHLWIAGDGPLRGELEDLARQREVLSRVQFLGWRRDVGSLLASADVFVCPSRHEPLGNVVIEAWAHGVPVVATASQGPSQLIDTGNTGILTPMNDAPALAQALRSVLNDTVLAARLRENGRQRYLEAFTETVVVQRYLEVLQRIRG